ncbi:helix-turn-helix domain-containing protein [Actinophytocola sp.]|uniref:AraC-like ligand-binding domain-containing protein n=1 Tax=Actinophytocola sp. TaxID=1872138 RepID=UPI002ED21271
MRAHDFEQLEKFQAAASQAFVPLRIDVPKGVGFHAAFAAKKINDVPITTITGTACSVRRDTRTIGSTDPELIKVVLHRRGRAGVEQDGRQWLLNPGDLVAYTTTRPYELRYWNDFDTTVIVVPRSRLGPNAELVGQRSAVHLPAGAGVSSVVTTCLNGLSTHLGEVSNAAGTHLADALVSLIISAFTEASPRRPEPTAHLADRIIAYCLTNLTNPTLSVESVARQHGISVRYLHKVIGRRNISLAAWIRRERLRRIHRDLSNPALSNKTTTEIAIRWGITDPTHLGRALKQEFGQTPTEIRRTDP